MDNIVCSGFAVSFFNLERDSSGQKRGGAFRARVLHMEGAKSGNPWLLLDTSRYCTFFTGISGDILI